ncbi:hypothetical protein [Burkholderia sp. GS2Y]|uniref:Uncharacterized protein n=1 Tax=Burkholderia theae TaxID=3143496 RepID=A0ABU9WMZ5_9BURK
MNDSNMPPKPSTVATSARLNEIMSNHVRSFLIIFLFGNLLWMFFVALSVGFNRDFWRIQGAAGLLSGASMITGALLGFVFGIPRSTAIGSSPTSAPAVVAPQTVARVAADLPPDVNRLQNADPQQGGGQFTDTTALITQSQHANASLAVVPNTNLEQISDWLTKVLVGVGLTQVGKLPHFMNILESKLTPALSPLPNGGIIGISICVAFGVGGFVWAYFESRTSLMHVFGDN